MATIRLPAYVQVRPLAGGKPGYYWVRPLWAKPPAVRNGKTCPIESTSLGTDVGEAISKGEAINAAFTEWRQGLETKAATGSVRWLFAWYRDQEKFTKLKAITRRGYKVAMDMVDAIEVKGGVLGSRPARAVDATAADRLYRKARDKHGERQGSYMMQVCRLVWNHGLRHHKATGLKENPFAAMGIKASSGTGRGNRAAAREEYELYRATARAIERPSMAVAAVLCFEACQRVYDAFGFEDPDGRVRGIMWAGYRPGHSLLLIQSKTGNPVEIPLTDRIDGEDVALYPELEAELAAIERREDGGLIVRDERTGEPYTTSYMQTLHRRILKKAGLPTDLRFTSFRHGGLTEIGDSGEDDVRAVSGHSTLEVTKIYNKANVAKARRIATRRREHIKAITEGDSASAEDDENGP